MRLDGSAGRIYFARRSEFIAGLPAPEVGEGFCRLFYSPEGEKQRIMNAEFLAVIDFWEREKGIRREILVSAVEEALLSAAKKAVGPARELRCVIDQKSGDIRAFAKLLIADKAVSKHDQISLPDARRLKPDAQIGDE